WPAYGFVHTSGVNPKSIRSHSSVTSHALGTYASSVPGFWPGRVDRSRARWKRTYPVRDRKNELTLISIRPAFGSFQTSGSANLSPHTMNTAEGAAGRACHVLTRPHPTFQP